MDSLRLSTHREFMILNGWCCYKLYIEEKWDQVDNIWSRHVTTLSASSTTTTTTTTRATGLISECIEKEEMMKNGIKAWSISILKNTFNEFKIHQFKKVLPSWGRSTLSKTNLYILLIEDDIDTFQEDISHFIKHQSNPNPKSQSLWLILNC